MFRRVFFANLMAVVPSSSFAVAQVAVPPAPPPPASISLGARHGHVTPYRSGFNHTGGGNIDVAQPSPDTVVVTMTGIGVAGGHPCKASLAAMSFEVTQALEVRFDSPKLKKAKLIVEGRVIGLLRSECKGTGSACEGPGCATLSSGTTEIVTLCLPAHSVAGGENLSINDREGPSEVPIAPGKYTLHQTFAVTASHSQSLLFSKAASAEFAADPALDPLWISYWEPFHGANKKDFGFQITIKVLEDTSSANGGASGQK